MNTIRWHLATLALTAVAVALLAAGCETLTSTTMDENYGAYLDAREFLTCGQTSRSQVAAKYGKPTQVKPVEGGGEYWEYRKRESVALNTSSRTPMGTDGSMLRNPRGFQSSVERTTRLEVFFDANGILAYYRLDRGAR
jgi:outer membrane protein assembly factor BamE (lipoprotein component of BamABCDE complex)